MLSKILFGDIMASVFTHQLLPVHALKKVLKLQLALLLGAGLSDAVGTFDPLFLESVAACRPFVWLRAALQQDPLIHVYTQPRLKVEERHDAEGNTSYNTSHKTFNSSKQ